MAGIKTVPVAYRPMSRQIKTVGYVTYDESGLSRIVSRVDGYVEKLYVDKSFTMVHKGDPLAEIYSPELYSTAQELVLATRGREASASWRPPPGTSSCCWASASRKSTASWPRASRAAAGDPLAADRLRGGRRRSWSGASVEAKMTLFEVADLSTVWIEAEVYEKDIPFLQAGQEVEATVEAYPNRNFTESWPWSIPNWTRRRGPTVSRISWKTATTNCGPACLPRCGSTRRWRRSSRIRAQAAEGGHAVSLSALSTPPSTASSHRSSLSCRSGP